MNQGLYGFPDTRLGLRPSSTTLEAVDNGWEKLVLASRPAADSLQIWRDGVITTAYTLTGREVVFDAAIAVGEVVTDNYWTSGAIGESHFAGYHVQSLSLATLALTPLGYWKLDDPSGTTAADSSGNAHTADLLNTPTLDQDPIFGGASRSMLFNGTNEYVQYDDTNTFNLFTAWSLQVCCQPTSNNGAIFTHRYSSRVPWCLMRGAEVSAARFAGGFYNGGWQLATDANDTNLNEPYHLVATYNGTTLKLYINGVEEATSTPSSAQSEGSVDGLRIGGRWDGNPPGSTYFTGYISDAAIWNTALSAGDVTTLYGQLTP